jgi:AAA domain, putative AbiEii toxin, Type IV TA system
LLEQDCVRALKLTLKGYRRFRESTSLLLDEDVVALVGPNEAGKSSVLSALQHFNNFEPIEQRDWTRDGASAPELTLLFTLDDADREALREVPGGSEIRRLWLTKNADGHRTGRLEPRPVRDLQLRQQARVQLEELSTSPALDPQYAPPDTAWEQSLLPDVISALSAETEDLAPDTYVLIRTFIDALRSLNPPQDLVGPDDRPELERLRAIADALDQLIRVEELPRPEQRSLAVLDERLPPFVWFTQENRDLQDAYDLTDEGSWNSALLNLARLAGIDLHVLVEAINSGMPARGQHLADIANHRLAEIFTGDWSGVVPRIEPDGSLLRIYVETESDNLSAIGERSDGLIWFVALRAFLTVVSDPRPVLLVDEAETHLHYDAQADLVRVLSTQELAAKVIYTTHSAGCLPEDLGTGVRAVVRDSDRESSHIDNRFWTSGPGFAPLLFAMGATVLPFSVPRYLLVGEGACECILLPTLLREATDVPRLEYRIGPGIAEANEVALAQLDREAGRVGFFVDGDDHGETHADRLVAAGVQPNHIIRLRELTGDSCTLEDLVDSNVFADAVNSQLQQWGDTEDRFSGSQLPDTGRSGFVAEWCGERGARVPGKTAVAQTIVGLRKDPDTGERRRLVSPRRSSILHDFDARARQILEVGGSHA